MSPKHLVVFLAVVLLLTEVSLADPYESKKGPAVGKRPRVRPHVPSTTAEVSLADPYESKKGPQPPGSKHPGHPHVPSTTAEVSLADPYESKQRGPPVGKRPRHPHVPSTTAEVSLADPYESKKGAPGTRPRHPHVPSTTAEVSLADPYESKKGSPRVGEPGRPRPHKDASIDADSISKAAGPGSKTNPPTKGPGGRRRCPKIKCSDFEAVDDEKNYNPLGGKPLTPGSKTNP